MSKFSCVRFRLFVAWGVHTVVFLPIFVFWLFLFHWFLCCLYCFYWLTPWEFFTSALSWFCCSIPSVRCRFPLFIISMAHFSILNSIPTFWLYILTACIKISNSFSIFANSLMSSMYIKRLIFSCELQSLYPAVHFLSMWLSGNGDKHHLEIYFLGFSFQLSFSCCQFSFPRFHGFLDKVYDFIWYFVHF